MGPNAGGAPTGKLADAIQSTFGGLDGLKTKIKEAALARFGSGWAWLVLDNGKLEITSTANQDTPLMTGKSRSLEWMFGNTPTTCATKTSGPIMSTPGGKWSTGRPSNPTSGLKLPAGNENQTKNPGNIPGFFVDSKPGARVFSRQD